LFGQDFFYEDILGLRFKISTFSFFQTNSLGAEVLYDTAREFVGETKDKLIFDLYSGTGTIAQLLAPVAKKVIGVEIVEEAVVAARENTALNGLNNCEFIAGDVLKVIDSIEDKPDLIVLDPPRDGIHPKALDKIIDYGVDRLVYISCKPTSLARDLVVLQERGYKVEKVCAVDMFPNTVHVETVVLLSQQKPSDKIEVDLDLDELDVTSTEMKATYAEIKDYVLKKHGLKVSNLYISQVKNASKNACVRKCGLEVGENYNLAKSEDAKQPNCPEEKEKAILEALEHFGMVS
jgi:precorrin-6B methylase 2